jgi:indole-3-glycerol phosphate synthase
LSILVEILDNTRKDVAAQKERVREADLRTACQRAAPVRSLERALRRNADEPIRVLAEVKRASPSAGAIWADTDPAEVAAAYERGGAAAVSVLTDKKYFAGDLAFLGAVRRAVKIPILRKDFIVDVYQLFEARAAGADAVLLIVAALDDADLRLLFATAGELGLEVLVEVHNVDEARRAVSVGARIIGVNHRDLKTFSMDLGLSAQLKPMFPQGTVRVAESGIKTADDVQRMRDAGCDAILVGESLMKTREPERALRALLGNP